MVAEVTIQSCAAARDVLVDHLLDDVELVPEQRQPDTWSEETEPEALEGDRSAASTRPL